MVIMPIPAVSQIAYSSQAARAAPKTSDAADCKIRAGAFSQLTHTRGSGNETPWQIGPQINLPIFSGGANKANLSAAESRAVQAEIKWRPTVVAAIEGMSRTVTRPGAEERTPSKSNAA